MTIPYDKNCKHLEDANMKGGLTLGLIEGIKTYCNKIAHTYNTIRNK